MSAPVVVKIGGSTLGAAGHTFSDLAKFAATDHIPVVVHGGGAEATAWLEAMQIPSRFENGLRVTDDAALPIIVAVYAGLVNKRVVASLLDAGVLASGLCGVDGDTVECRPSDPALGRVGEPERVRLETLHALLAAGVMPVVGPVGFVREGGERQLVNVNADTVAAAIAGGLDSPELVLMTDVSGVQGADGNVVPRLTSAEAESLIASGVASGGMVPKLRACLESTRRGVPARILDGRRAGALLDRGEHGTLIVP
ncbi:MAG: acetylglutamate kinase [Dehalococcoidia bacterium]|nr:acetylglutamate kinase [Dehalococcoidia bacterium]MCA9845459.1 acetylglutamate kinase [Dehalococcoidia bacterium]MCA9854725.1 acetylglutamate kinase [Dehalococcoidia bacterium]